MTQTGQLQRHSDAATPANPQNSRTPRRWITIADGQRLRRQRRQRGLSQEALADQAGISLTTVARLERQHRSPCRTWTLARIAAALDEHPASFRFGDSPSANRITQPRKPS
jgi:DNA-binding XRE family transcriptional regulator